MGRNPRTASTQPKQQMNTLKQAHGRLSDLLKNMDAGNDEIRDAAISLCEELQSNTHLLNESHHAANLVEIARALTLLNPERWAYTIAAIDEIIRLAKVFTQGESELIGDCWDGGNWEEAVAQVAREFNEAAAVHIDDGALLRMCRRSISAWSASVRCKFCDNVIPAATTHRHQGEYVGECCWDERLRATE